MENKSGNLQHAVDRTEASDEALVLEVQTGSKAAFEVLWKRHETSLYHWALARLKNQELTWDLCQTVALKAFTKLDQFTVGKCFRSWLYKIAHNQIIDTIRHLRGRREQSLTSHERVISTHADQFQSTLERERMDQLRKLAEELPERQKEILECLLRGMTQTEITAHLGLCTSTAGVGIHRTRKALRELFRNHDLEDLLTAA